MKLMAMMIEHPYHYEDVKRAYALDAELMILDFLCKHQEINIKKKRESILPFVYELLTIE